MIEVSNLSFSYGKKPILRHISFRLEPGKLYVILGPNGSGKTTLLHTLARLHMPIAPCSLDGEPYAHISRRAFARTLALLPQERAIPDMRVWDLVAAGRYPYIGLSRKLDASDIRIVQNAMERTNTAIWAERNMQTLSGGERQRVYIAMLLAQDTPYVLLDEPTSHLDSACGFDIMRLLSAIRDEGKCVVTVLHDIPLALQYADTILVLQNGTLRAIGTPEQIGCDGILESVFHVRCHPMKLDGRIVYGISPL